MKALVLAAAAMVLALAAPAAGADYVIVIDQMAFGALPETLHPGDTITWRNDDLFRHTATARDGSFDLDLPPKTEATLVLEREGEFDFFCRFHPGMIGQLVVTPVTP